MARSEGTQANADFGLAREVLRLRLSQMLINEMYRAKAFKVPIHLAMGHEAIAVGVVGALAAADRLVLPHRNLHYNLAKADALRAVVDEFLLKPEGLARGKLGSMNLANPDAGVTYSSSILGNNFGVAVGLGLALKLRAEGGLVCVVTGDGAIEEGAFHEALVFLAGHRIPALVVVENNGWSLASTIAERRGPIDLGGLARALGAGYRALAGNDVQAYRDAAADSRAEALARGGPIVIEAGLDSLGSWRMKTPDHPEGKYINYHAGPAPEIEPREWPALAADASDPVHVLTARFAEERLRGEAAAMLARLRKELA
ncbi:MAG: thiamine pyrophosphate-dependent enzyme [Tagaea sp.]|nr:thiamine pyrophosphate-dependent enzyme [Tagaea sp.]